ncbi:MAG: methyltransferase domain-containing protein [Terriglobia bacterium]
MASFLHHLLAHPLTRGLDLDDPATTHIRRAIIEDKPFLKRIYQEWYGAIAGNLPPGPGGIVELGSGAGFLEQSIPGLITSEVFLCPGISLVLDGRRLPFADNSLRAICMSNVFHHIPRARAFLSEASRCLRSGGRIIAIEPWVSPWSRGVYTRLHHEPFDPSAEDWVFSGAGPLSSANGALPWIVFERDRARFETEFRQLRVLSTEGLMPFRYLICGGISTRNVMPAFTWNLWKGIETAMRPAMRSWAMFALIVIEKL